MRTEVAVGWQTPTAAPFFNSAHRLGLYEKWEASQTLCGKSPAKSSKRHYKSV